MKMLKFPVAVVFDMDGLLFDSEALCRDAIMAAAVELGHKFIADDFLKLLGRPWDINRVTLQHHIGAEGDLEAFRAAWTRKIEETKDSLALKAGVFEILDRLDALCLPRAICTSSSRSAVQHNLNLHNISGRFDAIVAYGDYGRGKPCPDPFLKAAEVLGFPPGDCWALEDSYPGVQAAAAAGMQTVMVPDLLPATDEIRLLCRLVAADLLEVSNYLEVLANHA